MDSIQKKMMGENAINPFNEQYKHDAVNNIIREAIANNFQDIDVRNLETITTLSYFNEFYKKLIDDCQDTLFKSKVDYKSVISFLIASANRTTVISDNRMSQFTSNPEKLTELRSFDEVLTLRTISNDNAVEIAPLGEQSIEVVNYALKLLNKCTFHDGETDIENLFPYYFRFFYIGNIFYLFKTFYESAVWENGYIKTDQSSGSLVLEFKDKELLYIKRIGELRFRRAVSGLLITTLQNKLLLNILSSSYRRLKGVKYSTSVSVNEGEIKLSINTNSDGGLLNFVRYICTRDTFYPFLEEGDKLPKLPGLTLDDIQVLYSEIAHIVQHSVRIVSKEGFGKGTIEANINRYDFRIGVNHLKETLLNITAYSETQIDVFLTLLEYDSTKNDLWKTPLVKIDGYYHVPVEALALNSVYHIDYILQAGGVSMKERGKSLERYISSQISEWLTKKGFNFKIANTKKFKSPKKTKEEIDLVLNTSKAVLIGEIKCISSPVDSRSTNYAMKDLRDAVKQVKRKKEFIESNLKYFSDLIGDTTNKDVFGIVITNLPHFTGYSINGISIIDILYLDNYFNVGEFHDSLTGKTHKYYSNDQEFSQNLKSHLANPVVVSSSRQLFTLSNKRFTPEDISPILISEVVESTGEIL